MPWSTPKTDWETDDLVTAAYMNDKVGENLNYLLTPNQFAVSEFSGTYTTTNTSYVAVNANYTKSITLSGGHLLVGVDGNVGISGGGAYLVWVVLDIDGSTQIQINTNQGTAANIPNLSWTYLITGLSASSHTVSLKWKVSNASGVATIDKTYIPFLFWGIEI